MYEDGALFNLSWEVAVAQFGYQSYGGALDAFLIIPMAPEYHLECGAGEPKYVNNSDGSAGSDGSDGESSLHELANPYLHRINDWDVSDDDITDYIFVIDRGDCYFVEKIENAQSLGASAVIICDKQAESLFTMWMPESWEDDIGIPSVLLQESHCETLLAHLGVQAWEPLHMEHTTYPSVDAFNWTVARLEWGLPHNDDKVEWELWTSSNDEDAMAFKRNFRETSNMLDAANDTRFEPHLYVLDGAHWGCDDATLPCGRQCSNNGRYCAVDPEFDTSLGLDGLDVVQENLRSLCVWEFDKNFSQPNNNTLWWDYTVLWDSQCFAPDIAKHPGPGAHSSFTENCSLAIMKALHPSAYHTNEPTLHEFVTECIAQSGGSAYTDGPNALLAREAQSRTDSSVYALPMVRVNEFMIHGNIDCAVVTIQECTVLAAICAGFIQGTQPPVCFATPAPTAVQCEHYERDCNGTCFGFRRLDKCGRCLFEYEDAFDACVGCDGVAHSGYADNPCGECRDRTSDDFASFGKDCADICFGDSVVDRCGLCLLPSAPQFDACVGCDNIAHSSHAFNACGYCIDLATPGFDSYGEDCAGVCDGDRHRDDCGQCLLLSDANFNACGDASGNSSPNNGGAPSNSAADRTLTVIVVAVSVIAFLVVVVAVVVIARLWRKQIAISNRFNSLAATYQIMDENPAVNSPQNTQFQEDDIDIHGQEAQNE